MKIIYGAEDIMGACGVSHVQEFEKDEGDGNSYYHPELHVEDLLPGQAGLVMAAFIKDDAICKQAYRELRKRFNMVYQSSYRLNKNSGNMFKVVIYDGLKK